MKPNGKCICKKCEDCNFYQPWTMTKKDGLLKTMKKCGFQVLFEEIPSIRGSIDGLQQATNESRNRSMETRQAVDNFGSACLKSFHLIAKKVKLLK